MKIEIEVQDVQEAAAIQLLIKERRRQDAKFGKQDHDPAWWMVIMGEEYGETCQAVCEYRWAEVNQDGRNRMQRIDHAVAEASQVAAVGVAMIQAILRNEWKDEISTVLPSDKRQVAKALDWDDSKIAYDQTDVVDPDDDKYDVFTCYHCSLEIQKLPSGEWRHVDYAAYDAWREFIPGREHAARYEPVCFDCGRDNANGTHAALTRTGHLNHPFNPTGS